MIENSAYLFEEDLNMNSSTLRKSAPLENEHLRR